MRLQATDRCMNRISHNPNHGARLWIKQKESILLLLVQRAEESQRAGGEASLFVEMCAGAVAMTSRKFVFFCAILIPDLQFTIFWSLPHSEIQVPSNVEKLAAE